MALCLLAFAWIFVPSMVTCPSFTKSGLLAQWQCLHKEFTQLGQMLFPKIRYGVVIRMLVRRQIAERHVLKGLPLDGSGRLPMLEHHLHIVYIELIFA